MRKLCVVVFPLNSEKMKTVTERSYENFVSELKTDLNLVLSPTSYDIWEVESDEHLLLNVDHESKVTNEAVDRMLGIKK